MTRKGLALGVASALASAALIAVPAQAANEITLAVSQGTGNTTILGEAFTVRATVGALVPDSENSDVTFAVTNSAGETLTYASDPGTPGTTGGAVDVDGVKVDGGATGATGTSSGTSDAVKPAFHDTDGAASGTGTFTDNQTLSITSAATTGHSVTVTAFIDDDGDGVVDSSEYSSSALTISFVKAADAGITVAVSPNPQLGDGTVKAKITSSVINVAQVSASRFGVQFGKYISGTATAITSGYTYGTLTAAAIATRGEAVSLNSDKNALESAAENVTYTEGGAQTTFLAGNYILQAIYSTNPGTAAWTKVGSEASFGLTAAVADANTSEVEVVAVAGSVLTTGSVKKGYTGNVTYRVTVLDADEAPLANRVVRMTVTGVTGTIKVNGATVSAKDFEATTNASGVADFVFTNAAAATNDGVTITAIKSEGVTLVADADNLAWVAATWTAVETTAGAVSQDNNRTRAVDKGATTTLTFSVRDQFGNAFADSAYRMKASVTGRTVTTLTDSLSDGAASFAIADGANTSGDTTVALSYEKLTDGVWGANTDITALNDRTIKYYDQTNSVAVTETTVSARAALKAAKAVDTRTGAAATVFDTAGANSSERARINGTVTNKTTAAAQAGSLVTVSGDSSLLFNVGDVYAFGSLTFYDTDGTLVIDIYSNKAQSNTVVTVTSADGGSDTVKVSFAGVATNAGKTLTIDAPAYVDKGSTLQAIATLVDTYGNAVNTTLAAAVDYNDDTDTTDAGETTTNFKVEVTGPGITISTLPTTTDADGKATVNRLLGQNDSGSIVIKVSYDQNDDGDYSDTTDLVVSKTVTVGSAPAVGKVNVGSFNGKLVVYASGLNGKRISWKVGGNWGSQVAASNYAIFNRPTPRAGVTVSVDIYVNGVKTLTKSVVTR